MSQLLDNSYQIQKNTLKAHPTHNLRSLFFEHFSKFPWLQPELVYVNQQTIKFNFTYVNKSDLPISKAYFFSLFFNVKNNQFVLSAKWILNQLPMKTKISQANYFYAFEAIKMLQTITEDKNLKLIINPFRQTFGLLWSAFLYCRTVNQFLQISKKVLDRLMKSFILKFSDIDTILNQFLLGAHNKTSASLSDIHLSIRKDLSKLVCFLTTDELSNRPLQQNQISNLSQDKFISHIEKKYLKASQKIIKLSLQGIYGGVSTENPKKSLTIETLNSIICGSDKLILGQDPCNEQIVAFININLKNCNLQKGKNIYIKINTSTKGKTASSCQNNDNLIKLKVEIPQNIQEQNLFLHENQIVSTFFTRIRSKHFKKYYINISNTKQLPVRMTLDHKQMTLRKFLNNNQGWISFKTKIYILCQILFAMKRLWKHEIAYLGLNSQAILVQWKKGKMNIRITNFGQSFHQQLCNHNENYRPNLNSEYSAPQIKELLQASKSITHLQDIYSFGVLICQIFFHKLPKLDYERSQQTKGHILLKAFALEGLKWEQNFCQIIAKLTKQCLQICPSNRPDPEFLSLILGYLGGY